MATKAVDIHCTMVYLGDKPALKGLTSRQRPCVTLSLQWALSCVLCGAVLVNYSCCIPSEVV